MNANNRLNEEISKSTFTGVLAIYEKRYPVIQPIELAKTCLRVLISSPRNAMTQKIFLITFSEMRFTSSQSYTTECLSIRMVYKLQKRQPVMRKYWINKCFNLGSIFPQPCRFQIQTGKKETIQEVDLFSWLRFCHLQSQYSHNEIDYNCRQRWV